MSQPPLPPPPYQYPYPAPPPTPYPYPYPPPQASSVGSDIYEGAAAVGKVQAGFGLVVGAIFGIICLVLGFVILFSKVEERIQVQGRVLQINGSSSGVCGLQTDKKYSCNILVQVENVDQPLELPYSSSVNIFPNSKVTLYALKDDPRNVSSFPPQSRWPGLLVILFGLAIFGLTYFSFYMTKKHKMYAAAQGVQSALSYGGRSVSLPFDVLSGVSNVFGRRR
jgi:hypothetical protein